MTPDESTPKRTPDHSEGAEPAATAARPYDPLDVDVPRDATPTHPGVEQHVLEISPAILNGASIRLALQIKPGQNGGYSATLVQGPSGAVESSPGPGTKMSSDGKPVYGHYKDRIVEAFLADVDEFLHSPHGRDWGEIALLKAGGNDHRVINRIKAGEGFRIDTLEAIAETMNKAVRGELDPQKFRNTAASRAGSGSEGAQPSGSEGDAHGKRTPRRKQRD